MYEEGTISSGAPLSLVRSQNRLISLDLKSEEDSRGNISFTVYNKKIISSRLHI